jgi:hypothetical protein
MKRDRLILVVALGTCLLAAAGAFGQNKAGPGPFDGKWIGESARCFPASNTYRFNGLTVTNGGFNWTTTDGGRQSQCRVTVAANGSFETNKDCAFQLSGKFEGKKVAIRAKTSERDCEIVARRE